MAGLAADVNEAAVTLDDAGDSGEPETGAAANTFGGEHRMDFILGVGGNSTFPLLDYLLVKRLLTVSILCCLFYDYPYGFCFTAIRHLQNVCTCSYLFVQHYSM